MDPSGIIHSANPTHSSIKIGAHMSNPVATSTNSAQPAAANSEKLGCCGSAWKALADCATSIWEAFKSCLAWIAGLFCCRCSSSAASETKKSATGGDVAPPKAPTPKPTPPAPRAAPASATTPAPASFPKGYAQFSGPEAEWELGGGR